MGRNLIAKITSLSHRNSENIAMCQRNNCWHLNKSKFKALFIFICVIMSKKNITNTH